MVDLACAEPAFLDLTFPGLESIPMPGEERLAQDFLRSPGGGAITAVGAARLGLSSVVVSPLGDDAPGELLRVLLAAEGVRWAGRRVARSPVTVIMPSDGDRAMATFDPGDTASAEEVAAAARARPAGRAGVRGRRRRGRAGAGRGRAARPVGHSRAAGQRARGA